MSDSGSEIQYIEPDSAPLQIKTTVVELCPLVVTDFCCMALLPTVGESIESLGVDAPDAVASGMEAAGGSSKVVTCAWVRMCSRQRYL